MSIGNAKDVNVTKSTSHTSIISVSGFVIESDVILYKLDLFGGDYPYNHPVPPSLRCPGCHALSPMILSVTWLKAK